jgi:hypothetical protein
MNGFIKFALSTVVFNHAWIIRNLVFNNNNHNLELVNGGSNTIYLFNCSQTKVLSNQYNVFDMFPILHSFFSCLFFILCKIMIQQQRLDWMKCIPGHSKQMKALPWISWEASFVCMPDCRLSCLQIISFHKSVPLSFLLCWFCLKCACLFYWHKHNYILYRVETALALSFPKTKSKLLLL